MGVNKVNYGGQNILDISDTTATAADVAAGKYFYNADGDKTAGTNSGGGDSGDISLQSKSIEPDESSHTVTADSGYDGLSSVQVGAISSSYVGSGITRRSSSDLTASGATVTAPAGYYAEAASKSVATATQATPSIDVSSAGLITASASQSAGYVAAGTKSATHQLATQAGKTVTPTKASQTAVASGRYTTGAVIVAAIPDEYADTSDATAEAADISTGKTAYVNGEKITGTNSGSSSSTKNVQVYSGYGSAASTSYTATSVTLTVAKSGTYNISWVGWRQSSSGTNGSNLYKNGSSQGSAFTSFTGTYGQHPTLSNVALSAGDVLVVRARSRNTSYSMYVANLIIEEV